MKRKNILLVITTSILLLFGCRNSVPDNSINPETDLTTAEKACQEVGSIGQVLNGQVIIQDNEGNILTFNMSKDLVKNFDEYESLTFPLIAKVESNNIYLYENKGKGFVLVKDNIATYWTSSSFTYSIPKGILPELYFADFDNDEKNELAVLFYTRSGTEMSYEDLFIIDTVGKNNKKTFHAFSYTNKQFTKDLQKIVTYSIEENNDLTMHLNGESYTFATIENIDYLNVGSVSFFDIVDNKINITSDLGIVELNSFATKYDVLGQINITVGYKQNLFSIEKVMYSQDNYVSPLKGKPAL